MFKNFALAAALSSIMFADVSVTTTIFPLYDVVKTIGGDKVKLTNLVPFGVEAHEFEPKAKDIAALSKSDFFIISSPVFETWSTKIISSLKIQDKTIDMSQKVKLIEMKHSENEHEHKGSYDPHYWLSINNYMNVAKEVATLLSTKDPENAKLYEANLATYLAKLEALKTDYEVLKSCKNKKVIVNHDAFEYLAHEYGISQYSITGMTPETKPSPKQIAQLIDLTKKEKITTVFFEEFASDKVAKSIAKEANVKTDALRPVENITVAESKKGIGYIDIMKDNLIKLHDAMDCQ
ncbi:High-affinity zinc uptake system binding-protein ZnuA [Sulfurospirillum diekertiae]|uniref:High-affinity zinc uptake system binding-protein ZnuA n=1 Tax=Sulfurospirillum diekertiae TaxID=1854492 RepID=A0A290HEV1_9BACT|nr:metal ABC transporter substrate-binding protein [Sulfurospirillum diekertiae]ATB70053.1 High-affinity zinc uptake system binding-protein ZnuA [Sulfurospirillum diekertiae]